MSNKIVVPGYAKKVFYEGGIEYRNFSPDLVGLQLASNGGTPLFTMGSFSITTNMEPKVSRLPSTRKFSNFVSLSDLNLSLEQANTLLRNNIGVFLNSDKTNIKNYARFGSFTEFIRVSLENIITTWPASLYCTPINTNSINIGYTFEDYTYNSITEISTFKVNTSFIDNKFDLNYMSNGDILNTFNANNDLRNLVVNFNSYVVFVNDIEYPILDFIGSDTLLNDYIYLTIEGNPFTATTGYTKYHIKPNEIECEKFFNGLPDFEAYLLNRLIVPKYTAKFNYSTTGDDGVVINTSTSVTWPISDGYNLDFSTTTYEAYVNSLIEIATNSDLTESDLMYRFLVPESISDFDTVPVHLSYLQQDSSGQKMSKVLRIYGRNFDEINTYIDGISNANTVTYDKLDNMPDLYIKNLAKVLGWDLISSIIEIDLISSYLKPSKTSYSGHSVGLTPVEADIELWRRLILNTPWLWKSKGARKSIEFFLNFLGIPQGLIQLNEYIYKADGPIDLDLFTEALVMNNSNTDLSIYPFDNDGYPTPLPDTPSMYFQNKGLWYRETGGSGATIDINSGNNPHIGPYDGGSMYINQFRTLIPDFSAVTITSTTTTNESTQLFSNYNSGVITHYSGDTYVTATDIKGTSLSDCIVVKSSVIPDPIPTPILTDCGCPCEGEDDALSICVEAAIIPEKPKCNYRSKFSSEYGYFIFSETRPDYYGNLIDFETEFTTQECCKASNGIPQYYNEVSNGNVVNTGYLCCSTSAIRCGCFVSCNWQLIQTPILLPNYPTGVNGPQDDFLQFTRPDGTIGIVTSDGSHCSGSLNQFITATPNVIDPNTGEIGVGCKLNSQGVFDLNLGNSSQIYQYYNNRYNGKAPCCGK